MKFDEIREKFPRGCRVGPTDTHCHLEDPRYQEDQSLLDAVVVGYSRDNRCIRILRIGSSAIDTFYHGFYKKIADRVEDSVTDWITGERKGGNMKEAYVVFWRNIVSGGADGGIFEEEPVVCLSVTTRDRVMKEKMDKHMKVWREDNGDEPWEPYTSQLTGDTEGPAWRSVEVLE